MAATNTPPSEGKWETVDVPGDCLDSFPVRCASGLGVLGMRGVVTTAPVHKGDLLLSSPPYVAPILIPNLADSHCSACLESSKDGATLLRCKGCAYAHYCSTECQAADWANGHKKECKVIPELSQFGTADFVDIVLAGRCVRKRVRQLKSNPDGEWDLFFLKDNAEPARLFTLDTCKEREELVEKALAITRLFPANSITPEDMFKLLTLFQCNNFAVTSQLIASRAATVNLFGALVNHSCVPSCTLTYDPVTHAQQFRANRDLPAGTELTHTYVDVYAPTSERRAKLDSLYYFRCECERCVGGDAANALEKAPAMEDLQQGDYAAIEKAINATSDGGSAFDMPPSEVEILAALEGAMVRLRNSGSYEEEYKAAVALQQALAEKLHPLNRKLYMCNTNLFDCCMVRGDTQGAEDACRAFVTQLQYVYGYEHPMTGLMMMTLAELTAANGGEGAASVHAAAVDILTATHGANHPLVTEAAKKLGEFEEMGTRVAA